MDGLFRMSRKVIIVGDLNAKHTSWNINNPAGNLIHRYSLQTDVFINTPNEYTHYPVNGNNPSTIDLALVRNVEKISEVEAINDLPSDHLPIKFDIGEGTEHSIVRKLYNYKDANWNLYRTILRDTPTCGHINRPADNAATEQLTAAIVKAANETIPKVSVLSHKDHLPQDILNGIKERNQVRRTYERNREQLRWTT